MRKIAIILNILLIVGLIVLLGLESHPHTGEVLTALALITFAGINLYVIDIHGVDKGIFQSYAKRLELEQKLKIKKLNEQLNEKRP